jgi:hypothetical protein
METLSEILAGLAQWLKALVYLMLTPIGPLLFGVIALLLVYGMVLFVQSRGR